MLKIHTIGILALSLLAGGCAGTQATQDADASTVSDPLEGMNRFFFDLNQRLDRHAGKPAAIAYKENVPQRVRGSLHNVLDNLGGPVNVANDLLEAQFENAGIAAGRFLVNTTIGIAMLIGRFLMIVPILAMAGSLAAKKIAPPSSGTFPVSGGTFVILVLGTILLVGALNFLPALTLGPIVEHFLMGQGKLF